MYQRTVIALLVIAALLFTYIVAIDQSHRTTGELQKRRSHLVPAFNKAELTSIRLERPGQTTIELQKTDPKDTLHRGWHVISPNRMPADPLAIQSIISAIDFAIVKRRIADDAAKPQYGLTKPAITLTLKDSSSTATLLLGKRTRDGNDVYVQHRGSDEIVVVESDLYNVLDKGLFDVRDKHVFENWPGDPNHIVFAQSGEPSVHVKLNQGHWTVASDQKQRAAQPTAVRDFVKILKDLQAISYPNATSKKSTRTIALHYGQGMHNVIHLGTACEDGGVQLWLDSSNNVMCVRTEALSELLNFDNWVDTRLVPLALTDVQELKIDDGQNATHLKQDSAGVWALHDNAFQIDQQLIELLLTDLQQTKVYPIDAVEEADVDKDYQLTVVARDGSTVNLHLQQTAATQWQGTRREDGMSFTVNQSDGFTRMSTTPLFYRSRHLQLGQLDALERIQVESVLSQKLEKSSGRWILVEPVKAVAHAGTMQALQKLVTNPEILGFSSKSLAESGLDAPDRLVTAHFAAKEASIKGIDQTGTRTITVELGAIEGDRCYARVQGEDTIFTISAQLVSTLDRPLAAPNSLNIKPFEIKKMVLNFASGQRCIFKSENDLWTSRDCHADDKMIKRLLIDLGAQKALSAVKFANALDNPQLTVQLYGGEGSAPAVLEYGAKLTSYANAYLARRGDLPVIFAMPGGVVNELMTLCP